MAGKLKDYQVLDVFCGGTFYKVRHKVTNNIYAWKAYNCCAYSDEQIQIIAEEVKIIRKVLSDRLLRYYDTILHAPSKTLYFVLEYSSWRNVQELIEECTATGQYIAEGFIWSLLHELTQVCKAVEDLNLVVLQKCITASSIFFGEGGELRINCFDLKPQTETTELMQQVGDVMHRLCYLTNEFHDSTKTTHYSDDLRDVINFLIDNRNYNLRPDVLLYHPTVLANLETLSGSKILSELIVSKPPQLVSETNKCDAEKAVELSKALEPIPRTRFNIPDSPIYCNISPRKKPLPMSNDTVSNHVSLSPSLAALALELPGFVPRCRKPYSEMLGSFKSPKQVSEEILSKQWMERLIALREREDSLNKRERDLVVKEIINSPSTKIVNMNNSYDLLSSQDSNGITLPPVISQSKLEKKDYLSYRCRPRTSSVRSKSRRRNYGYEDLDSSLSADAGDSSMVITATKFTEANMPRRIIFPDVSSKKVHFTSSNPFVESDESVTLTFYDLENMEEKSNHSSRKENVSNDISKFKYLNSENSTCERKSRPKWSHSSPTKQDKLTKNIFRGNNCMRKSPSKLSISSQCSTSSRYSMMSRSQCSMDLSNKTSEGSISGRTRSKQSLAQTPTAPPDVKKFKSRKSLLHFKTPFKFRSSTKS